MPGKNRFLNSIQNMTLQEIEKLVRDEKLRLKGEFKKLSERARGCARGGALVLVPWCWCWC